MPLYPLIIRQFLITLVPTPVNSETINLLSLRPVLTVQYYSGIIAAIIFLLMAFRLFGPSIKLFIVCLLFGFNILIFGFELNLLTDSLSLFLLLIFSLFLILFIDSLRIYHLMIALFISSLLFLIRPVYSFIFTSLTSLLTLYLIFVNKKRKIFFLILTAAFSLIVPFIYSIENKRVFNYFGITTVGGHNLFAKIIQYNLDTGKIDEDNEYNKLLKNCIPRHLGEKSIVVDDCISILNLPTNAYDTVSSPVLSDFAKKVIFQQPFTYFLKSIMLFPSALFDYDNIPFNFISTWASNPHLFRFWQFSYDSYAVMQKFMIAYFIFYPYCWYKFIKQPNKTDMILLVFGTIILYQLFFNTFFVQSEYNRLRLPIEPMLLLFCFYYYTQVFSWMRKLIGQLVRACHVIFTYPKL